MNLIFRASSDGDRGSDFHHICDDYTNTLSVIKSSNGKIFGGFTTQNWSNNSREEIDWKNDDNAFLFSLDKNKCYFVNHPAFALRCDKNDLCSFGSGTDIRIRSDCRKECCNYERKNGSYTSKDEDDFVFTGGEYFKVEELEVYQLVMN